MADTQEKQRELDAVLAALAHEARRHVLLVVWFGGGAMSAGEIAGRFGHSWPTTSRHLRVLEQAGLLGFEKHGRTRVYRVNEEKLRVVHDWLRWFQPKGQQGQGPVPAAGAAVPPETLLRNIALAYPEAREDVQEGERAVKVGRKTFVLLRAVDRGFSVSAKLPLSREVALQYPFVE